MDRCSLPCGERVSWAVSARRLPQGGGKRHQALRGCSRWSEASGRVVPRQNRQTLECGHVGGLVEGPMLSEDVVDLCRDDAADEPTGVLQRVPFGHKSIEGLAGFGRGIVAQLVVDDVYDRLVENGIGRWPTRRP